MPKSARSMIQVFAAGIATLAFAAGANEAPPAAESVSAVWKAQVVELNFSTFDVAYSCASLQSKIASILRPVVAHRATRIGIRCSNLGSGTAATAQLLLVAPIAATPENLHAMTTYDARMQLLAKVRSMDLPTEEDIPRFDAGWRRVSLSRGKGLNLHSVDCDLVRSIRDQVLPHLSVKVTRSSNMCIGRRPILEVEALLPTAEALGTDL